jgi:tol-pal system-associated acyl-CoA thioesterase
VRRREHALDAARAAHDVADLLDRRELYGPRAPPARASVQQRLAAGPDGLLQDELLRRVLERVRPLTMNASSPGATHAFRVQIYYEDTDHSGLVYHANYLKYFERAREHLLGVSELVRLLNEDGIGFVVYKCEMTFREGAVFGDSLEIRTTPKRESDFRLVFQQDVYRGDKLLVQGVVQMVCIDRDKKLARVPDSVLARL